MEPIISFEPIGLLISVTIVLVVAVIIGIIFLRVLKSKKARIVGLVLLIFGISFGVFLSQNLKPNPIDTSAIHFLPTQSQIYSSLGEEETIQLFCFGYKQNPLLKEGINVIPVQTDNENINVVESTIDAGSTYRGLTVFSIFLDIDTGQPGNQSFSQIILTDGNGNTKTFDIGDIAIAVQEPNNGKAIDIRSHLGSANRGAQYSFSFKNGASKPCTITGIDFGSLTPFVQSVKVTVNDKEIETKNPMVAQPGDLVDLEAKLKNSTQVDIYLVSAKLRYRIQGDPEEYSYFVPYGTIGLPDSDESFQELAERYLQD